MPRWIEETRGNPRGNERKTQRKRTAGTRSFLQGAVAPTEIFPYRMDKIQIYIQITYTCNMTVHEKRNAKVILHAEIP